VCSADSDIGNQWICSLILKIKYQVWKIWSK
jgi:hypothetical protein